MTTELLLSLLGILLTIVSVAIAYMQLKYQLLGIKGFSATASNNVDNSASTYSGFSLFSPAARIKGISIAFIDRRKETNLLRKCLIQNKSLVVVEGVIGVGKTSLVANFCRSRLVSLLRYKVKWVFCSEKRLTLSLLARNILESDGSSKKVHFHQIDITETQQLTNIVIQYLSERKIILVLNDYHLISDKDIHDFITKVACCKSSSMIILTSELHTDFIERLPTTEIIRLNCLCKEDGVKFLKVHGVEADARILDRIWEKGGKGVPEAMRILAGLGKTGCAFEFLNDKFPTYTRDLELWLCPLINSLSEDELSIVKFVSLCNEPVSIDLLNCISPSNRDINQSLDHLLSKFILTQSRNYLMLHPLVQNYVSKLLSKEEREKFSIIITDYFADKAKSLLLGANEEPSYGKVYLEAHPEYVLDTERHGKFVDALLERLCENGFELPVGSKILVLGAGHGTHGSCLCKTWSSNP
jgi:hypothetical protein